MHNADYTQTPPTGAEWNKYFKTKYGVDNVKWKINNVDDIINNPQILRNYTFQEINQILGSSYKSGNYGSNGLGWKLIDGDKSVFYHAGGGKHNGYYYGVSSASTGKIKVVDPSTYIPLSWDKAKIIYD